MTMTDADGEREGVSETLITFSKWPYNIVKQLKDYVINDLKFRSLNDETNKKTQNSGVSIAIEGGITNYVRSISPNTIACKRCTED